MLKTVAAEASMASVEIFIHCHFGKNSPLVRIFSCAILTGMKKTNPTVHARSVRRWFRCVVNSIININQQDDISALQHRLHKLEELLDVVAREVARQAKLWTNVQKSK
jgi:hypothetical protein